MKKFTLMLLASLMLVFSSSTAVFANGSSVIQEYYLGYHEAGRVGIKGVSTFAAGSVNQQFVFEVRKLQSDGTWRGVQGSDAYYNSGHFWTTFAHGGWAPPLPSGYYKIVVIATSGVSLSNVETRVNLTNQPW
ncbi:hypothetical protein I6N90_00150 [Paenibacillus sp. GSMTC-2017]|nr:hypothetical protein [Paenibacillus sp. GSMTC-2017]